VSHLDGRPQGILLSTYADVRSALFNRDLLQAAHRDYEKGNIIEGVVMQLDGDPHRERRRLENPLFRRETLTYYESEVFPGVIDRLLGSLVVDGTGDLVEIGQVLTVVLSARISGIDLDPSDLDAIRDVVRLTHVFTQGTSITDSSRPKADVIADVQLALGSFERRYYAKSRERRLDRHRGGVGGEDDLLDRLLRAQAELGMDDATVLRETAFFLESGAVTSSLTLINTLDLLFSDPELLTSIRATVAESSRGEALEAIQRCVHEALRLNPIIPLMRRRARISTRVGEQEIPEGELVLLDIINANRDQSVFGGDADVFDPWRVPDSGVPLFGLSFGGGAHACIGQVLAGGLEQRGRSAPDAAERKFGQVALMAYALMAAQVRPHSVRPPELDPSTRRRRFEHYFVEMSL